MTRGRVVAVTVGAVAAVALAVGQASAALFLVLEPTSGPPGTRVIGRTGGEGALGEAPGARLAVFLVAEGVVGDLPGRVEGAEALAADGRLLPIGDLVIDTEGNGLFEFIVPELPPGRYEVFAHCPQCVESHSFGRNLLPVGELQVTDPASRYSPHFSPWPFLTAVMFVVLIVLAALVGKRRARRDQELFSA